MNSTRGGKEGERGRGHKRELQVFVVSLVQNIYQTGLGKVLNATISIFLSRLRAGSQDKDSPKDDHNLPNSQVDGGNEINSANCLPSKHLSYLTIPSLLILFYVKE